MNCSVCSRRVKWHLSSQRVTPIHLLTRPLKYFLTSSNKTHEAEVDKLFPGSQQMREEPAKAFELSLRRMGSGYGSLYPGVGSQRPGWIH